MLGRGVDPLRSYLLLAAKPGRWLYPQDVKCDRSDPEIVDEIVREKLFRLLNRQMPFEVTNRTIGWTMQKAKGVLRIDHAIAVPSTYVAKAVSAALPHLQPRAVRDIQAILDTPVRLQIHLEVDPGLKKRRR
eukprot:TRINITY_DN81590_c0_g1_i1.p2 TRINITY_DN81590_c0_g1~~TRINITY_DN81590_c0_g1_i1.p2  ORF type:complete len:132 (+),score=35.55 TRINITY_DN81590_c0_g1_i1:3-398(+)